MIELASGPIDPAALLSRFIASTADAGAIISFTGVVRSDGDDCSLWLDHHERLTIAAIEAVAAEARDRFELADVAVIHRVGTIAAAEPIVFVAASARHRRAAFDAVDFIVDHLKSEVPLWKRETRGGRSAWIEPRAQDYDDAARWSNGHG